MSVLDHTKDRLLHTLKGVVIGRWFIIAGLLLLIVLQWSLQLAVNPFTDLDLIWFAGIACAYNMFYTVAVRRDPASHTEGHVAFLGFAQVILDQLLVTAIVYYTGGVESVAFILYFFPILVATILYADLQIILLALVNSALYTALIVAEYLNIIPHLDRYNTDIGFYGNAQATFANTLSVNCIMLLMSMFAVFVSRIIRDRELEITIERDKVRTILNALEDGIIMLDDDQQVLLMNPPARDMLRLYGHFEGPFLDPTDFPQSYEQLIEVIRSHPNKKQLRTEVTITELEESTHVQVDSIPIYSSYGRIVAWVKVMRDITREKELDEIKSDFISVAAHQLRTPLAALKWFFRIMSEGDAGEVTPQQSDLLEQAYQRNNEVIEIVNNLLDISEIEEGRFPYDFAEHDVIPVIEMAIEAAQVEAKRQHVSIDFTHEVVEKVWVSMDKQKMRMAMQNLIDNAVKYSKPETSVVIKANVENARVIFSISDTGIGIAKEDQPKIFSKFFRGNNAKEWATTGSGLGLYIVRNVIHKHHGQIWFESEKDKGTTFFISIPIAEK